MTYLSSNQLKQYEDQGYISPIEVLSSSEALEAREEIEFIEKKMPNKIDKSGRYNVHLISPKLDSIVHNSKILDAVESIIGKKLKVGNVELEGIELCRPCRHLTEMLDHKNILKEFIRKGGLRCQILSSSNINIGDKIEILS